jgi:hypothetical protein
VGRRLQKRDRDRPQPSVDWSGGGIKQIKAKTVSFGATDAPLSGKDLDDSGLAQFPMVMGGIVPVVNLAGVQPGDLVLDDRSATSSTPMPSRTS